jgi:hypothetical protein
MFARDWPVDIISIEGIEEEVDPMCKTCRKHHPELYTDKPVDKTEKEKKAPAKKK